MKSLTVIALVFLLSCSCEQKDRTMAFDSLSTGIIDGFLLKDRKDQPLIIYTANTKGFIDFAIHHAPKLRETIRTVFNISDTVAIRKLLESGSFLDTTAKTSASNVRYVSNDSAAFNSQTNERIMNGASIIDFFIMLPTKDETKCVVYIHRIKSGTELALLEKNNNKWHVRSAEIELLE